MIRPGSSASARMQGRVRHLSEASAALQHPRRPGRAEGVADPGAGAGGVRVVPHGDLDAAGLEEVHLVAEGALPQWPLSLSLSLSLSLPKKYISSP
jgi:hypothetical protein